MNTKLSNPQIKLLNALYCSGLIFMVLSDNPKPINAMLKKGYIEIARAYEFGSDYAITEAGKRALGISDLPLDTEPMDTQLWASGD